MIEDQLLYKDRQIKIDQATSLGHINPEDVGISVSKMIDLTAAIDKLLKLNNLFEELGEEECYLSTVKV